MFKLNCVLVSSAGNICRQIAASVNASGGLLRGGLLQRSVHGSAARLQESQEKQDSLRSFSHFPPLPGQDSPLKWGGKRFDELPVAHVKATYNNTHIQVTDGAGLSLARTSCGTEGFKNIKKSTPLAAQTAGLSAGKKAIAKGVTFVRVVVKGLGPGRQSAIKGLTMGGLEVVSITDNTPVPHNGCRPRKARRI